MFRKKRRCHHRERHHCHRRKRHHFRHCGHEGFDVEAIADPVSQSACDGGKNAGGNLIQDSDKSDIKIDTHVTERGPGNQKVV
jgi:hypothetical protein